ncbi:MAG: NAD-dependent epimerase/dehydratase family protein [Desulfobulbaceae bacterium]|nr:NAD-dependent epimerase/dehydratase family protein [Desulfobulbaceae bacterium]
MQRALVTGGGGFVGLAIVRELAAMGVETSVAGRNHYPEVERLGAKCLVGDIRNRDFMLQAAAGKDTVFHAAAKAGIWGDRESYYSVNVTGTENVIEACRRERVRHLVHTSTPSVVFNGRDIEGGNETMPYSENPLCHYAATKILAEKMILAANSEKLKTTAIRPHLVWGPGDTQIIPRLLQRGKKGDLKIVGSGENRVDITYVDNVARGHVLAAENLENSAGAAGEAFFISQGEPVVLWQWINTLFTRLGIAPVEKRVALPAAYRVGWLLEKIYMVLRLQNEPKMTRFLAEQLAMSHWFCIDKAKSRLGYTPIISLESGIDRLLAWLDKENRQAAAGKSKLRKNSS